MIERLRDWSEIRKVVPREESAAVTGGREGELLLGQLVGSSFPFKDAHLLAGRRIPSKRQGRRREIDLIVCTPRMTHLIEVKNWSGQLTVHNGVWRQTRRGGSDLPTQGVEDRLPGAVGLPLLEVVVHGALGRQVVREHVPLAAGAVEVEDGVEHLPHLDLAWPSRRIDGDQRLDDDPLIIA